MAIDKGVGGGTISWYSAVFMVRVAQLDRAPDCGSGGRGFESRLSPFFRDAYCVMRIVQSPLC